MSAPQTAAARAECGPPLAAAPPDLLQAVLRAYPGELSLHEEADCLVLDITGPGLSGTLHADDHDTAQLAAMAYDWLRNQQKHAPRRCQCGWPYGAHDWDSRTGRGPRPQSGCAGYQPGSGP